MGEYDKQKLINFYIKNDVFFVSRFVKTKAYIGAGTLLLLYFIFTASIYFITI